jgi:hypothetical protein
MRPREGQAVSKLLCFLDQEEVLLPAELICAYQSSNVADGTLKDAAARHQHEIQLSCCNYLPDGVGGVRFHEVNAFCEVECFVKKVLD